MKRILMRVCVSPLEYHTPIEVIANNYIGYNSGNLLYQQSVLRSVMTADTDVDFITDYDLRGKVYLPEEVNERYDAVVLPFANAFREDFIRTLRYWTRFIRRLTIPCVVVGIGIQDTITPKFEKGFSFDEDVRKFLEAVLDHSPKIGVRGSVTEAYVKQLGFSQVDVIGCPSLYLFGEDLPVREKKELTREAVLGITGSVGNPVNLKKFFGRMRDTFPKYYYMPQLLDDLKLMYAGVPYPQEHEKAKQLFAGTLDHRDMQNGSARFFTNIRSMLEFTRGLDFNIGSRIHGGVSSLVTGVPNIFFPTDARVMELVEYHNLPHLRAAKVNDKTDIFELYAKTDFVQVRVGHKERFRHYLDFLENSGLEHVYGGDYNGSAPLDEKMAKTDYCPPVEALLAVPDSEKAQRLTEYYRMISAKKVEQLERIQEEQDKQTEKLQWYRDSSVLKIGVSRAIQRFTKRT